MDWTCTDFMLGLIIEGWAEDKNHRKSLQLKYMQQIVIVISEKYLNEDKYQESVMDCWLLQINKQFYITFGYIM